jgi:hypothetical protein
MIKPREWIIGCNVRWGNCLNQDGSLKADNRPTHKQHPPTAATDPIKRGNSQSGKMVGDSNCLCSFQGTAVGMEAKWAGLAYFDSFPDSQGIVG